MADQPRDVEGALGPVEGVEVLSKALPAPGQPAASAGPGMSSTPSINPISQSWRSGVAGAKPTPQLPITTVETPCHSEGASSGSQVACPS